MKPTKIPANVRSATTVAKTAMENALRVSIYSINLYLYSNWTSLLLLECGGKITLDKTTCKCTGCPPGKTYCGGDCINGN